MPSATSRGVALDDCRAVEASRGAAVGKKVRYVVDEMILLGRRSRSTGDRRLFIIDEPRATGRSTAGDGPWSFVGRGPNIVAFASRWSQVRHRRAVGVASNAPRRIDGCCPQSTHLRPCSSTRKRIYSGLAPIGRYRAFTTLRPLSTAAKAYDAQNFGAGKTTSNSPNRYCHCGATWNDPYGFIADVTLF
jgi:hypothetical protein